MSRCIFCGYCELACPFDAITLGNEFEISEYYARRPDLHEGHAARRADQEGAGRRPGRVYDTPIPYYKTALVILASAEQRPRLDRLGRGRVRAASGPRSRVISSRNPFYSALALIGNLGSLAVLYLLLSAEFVAAAQVLVYAGAVMVMFLFVIAYLGGRGRRALGRAGRQLADAGRRPSPPARCSSRSSSRSASQAGGRALSDAPRSSARSAAGARSAGCSSPTTCSRSRSPRSCCSSRRSAA